MLVFGGVLLQYLVMNMASIKSKGQFQLQRGTVALWPHTTRLGAATGTTELSTGSLDGYKAGAAATERARPGGFIGLTVPVVDFSILSWKRWKQQRKQNSKTTRSTKKMRRKAKYGTVMMLIIFKFRTRWTIGNVDYEITQEFVRISRDIWCLCTMYHCLPIVSCKFPIIPKCFCF